MRAGSLLALIIAVSGCGDGLPKRVPVAGKVLIDGQPLRIGQVMFAPSGERASIGAVGEDGGFRLSCYEVGDGTVIGTHRVAVTAAESLSETETRWHAPKKYSELTTSGLEATIEGPIDDLVIDLTWDGGKPFVERHGR